MLNRFKDYKKQHSIFPLQLMFIESIVDKLIALTSILS